MEVFSLFCLEHSEEDLETRRTSFHALVCMRQPLDWQPSYELYRVCTCKCYDAFCHAHYQWTWGPVCSTAEMRHGFTKVRLRSQVANLMRTNCTKHIVGIDGVIAVQLGVWL